MFTSSHTLVGRPGCSCVPEVMPRCHPRVRASFERRRVWLVHAGRASGVTRELAVDLRRAISGAYCGPNGETRPMVVGFHVRGLARFDL